MLYHEVNCDILAVAYRGYSASSGTPSESGLKLDAEAIMRFVKTDLARHYVNRGGFFILGRSLGGAVAATTIADMTQDSSYFDIDGVILENTFTSINDLVDYKFGLLAYFKTWILNNHWNVLEKVPLIKLPIHYVAGHKDDVVPFQQIETLLNASTESRWTNILDQKEGTHGDTWMVNKKRYINWLVWFFDEAHNVSQEVRQERQKAARTRVSKWGYVVENNNNGNSSNNANSQQNSGNQGKSSEASTSDHNATKQ